jgi:hypothetical protein
LVKEGWPRHQENGPVPLIGADGVVCSTSRHANFDNSPANPLNPDPTKPVAWGQQVWEEMHSVYMTWTEINDKNKDDTAPIQIPVSKAFTTGVLNVTK